MPSSAMRASSAGVGGAPPVADADRARELAALRGRVPREHDQHRRRGVEMRDAGLAQVLPDELGIELAQAQVRRARGGDAPR